jgi:Flp pilus assembly protein protease CpaA
MAAFCCLEAWLLTSTLLLSLSPLLLLIVFVGTVLIIALLRARPEDVPDVLKLGEALVRRLANWRHQHLQGGSSTEKSCNMNDEEER